MGPAGSVIGASLWLGEAEGVDFRPVKASQTPMLTECDGLVETKEKSQMDAAMGKEWLGGDERVVAANFFSDLSSHRAGPEIRAGNEPIGCWTSLMQNTAPVSLNP